MYACDQADHKQKPKSTTFDGFDQSKLLIWLGQPKYDQKTIKQKTQNQTNQPNKRRLQV